MPMLVWSASADTIAPPAHAAYLQQALAGRVDVDLRVTEGASHLSFLNVLPPHIQDPLPDREAFLDHLTTEVCAFALDRRSVSECYSP